jgi:hypothetical protein
MLLLFRSIHSLKLSSHPSLYRTPRLRSLSMKSTKPDKSNTKLQEKVEPKKVVIKSLDFLENIPPESFKAGHDLRKDQRQVLRQERVKAVEKYAIKSKASSSEHKLRFKLGNGVEALTTESLLGLVKLTTPYHFPEHEIKLVLDDESDYDQNLADSMHHPKATKRMAELSVEKDGWLKILQSNRHIAASENPSAEDRIDYFAICLASHFATCATYVPTDVDSKIRGHCWYDPDLEVLKEQYRIVKNALSWQVDDVSKRTVKVSEVDEQLPISGHDGEFLGILAGAWGAFLRVGEHDLATEAEGLINKELEREAKAFRYLAKQPSSLETDTKLLKLTAIMTHNVGDVDQGLSYWIENYNKKTSKLSKDELKGYMHKYSKLAHERYDRYHGEFARAKIIYKELLSAEGHRNYPLREAKCLRSDAELALPLGNDRLD